MKPRVCFAYANVFGQRARAVRMGEYTLMPDGTLKREGHPDSEYGALKVHPDKRRLTVLDKNGRPVVTVGAEGISVEQPEEVPAVIAKDVQQKESATGEAQQAEAPAQTDEPPQGEAQAA
jgi:hypothetical protein